MEIKPPQRPCNARVARHGWSVSRKGETSRLAELHQDGATKIRFPQPCQPSDLEAVLINTSGGLTGGDALSWNVDVGDAAMATVTTQACEKIYRSAGGPACVEATLRVGGGAFLRWLPQETILFDRSRLDRRLELDLADDASALLSEAVLFGRTARGEKFETGRFRDRWQVRVAGRLVHREDAVLDGDTGTLLGEPAVAGGAAAMATVLLISPQAEDLLPQARRVLERTDASSSGVSAWSLAGTGKLLARLLAEDGYALRKSLVPLLELLSKQASVPKVWSI